MLGRDGCGVGICCDEGHFCDGLATGDVLGRDGCGAGGMCCLITAPLLDLSSLLPAWSEES